MKDLAILDERIGESHTDVPGPDGKMGFGGTCLPKDISSLREQFKTEEQDLLGAVIKQNKEIRNDTSTQNKR